MGARQLVLTLRHGVTDTCRAASQLAAFLNQPRKRHGCLDSRWKVSEALGITPSEIANFLYTNPNPKAHIHFGC
jgi:hypothetical protein